MPRVDRRHCPSIAIVIDHHELNHLAEDLLRERLLGPAAPGLDVFGRVDLGEPDLDRVPVHEGDGVAVGYAHNLADEEPN
jgi:hypothetical protein